MIWALWYGVLSSWKQPEEDGYTGQQQYSGRLWCLKNAQLVLEGPKIWKCLPHWYTTTTRLNCWYEAGWIHAFMLFAPNTDRTFQIKTHQTRQHFSNFPLSNCGEPVQTVTEVSCSKLTAKQWKRYHDSYLTKHNVIGLYFSKVV